MVPTIDAGRRYTGIVVILLGIIIGTVLGTRDKSPNTAPSLRTCLASRHFEGETGARNSRPHSGVVVE
jgi:hypothetical protein